MGNGFDIAKRGSNVAIRGNDSWLAQPNSQEYAFDQKVDEMIQMYAILTYLVDKLNVIDAEKVNLIK